MTIVLTAGLFLSGSLMFSYWLGLAAKKNLKVVGDGNPGAMNLWKASGYKLGVAGILLDFLKGYLPLLFVIESGFGQGYLIVPLALAPVAGHAFSPFLKGKGGKAIAVTFGIWSALTGFEVSLVYAVILAMMVAVTRPIYKSRPKSTAADGLQVVCGMLLLSVYLYMRMFPAAILWVWFGNCVILVYTHRFEMAGWLKRVFNK
ncbi:glycerol-3-phosphate acyltransferase [Paenibacillus eucommiae]|uniref:Acyl-phosphate glycerol 3-phosphate acyltransferase n=1 Tax=Paenibacillus eucommiae TaxID=1355755 RepID=A0ABS4JAK8_9BACL|nr:glycerol-3-phosphate acyltransferase [Paenibacillus eucommiae]MBP1995774.1 acyl-phosphate glycerol 3-phosphate acyltransferase [Paenibacillus eucommiae]